MRRMHLINGARVRTFQRAAPVLASLLLPASGWACAACYGEPGSPAARGLTWAIVVLGLLVVAVLTGIVAFFVHAARKAAELDAAIPPAALAEKT